MTSSQTASYQASARKYARQYGLDENIFLAQITQESGWNPTAVSPAGALGIAQFMPGTAASMGVNPMDPEDALAGAARLMRSHLDQFGGSYPMALAAYNAGAGAVQEYGGIPPYPETQSYVNSIMAAAGRMPNPTTLPDTAESSGQLSGRGQVAVASPYSDLVFPQTNYQVIPGSAALGDILYGRRYRILVTSGGHRQASSVLPDTAEGQAAASDVETALDVSQLRCTFRVVKTCLVQPNWSTVTIYNLSPSTENAIIQEGFRLVIEAGYVGSQYGVIFDGDVLQVLRNKEDGTTYSLTLVAMDSDAFLTYGTSVFTVLRGQNSRQIVDQVASTASIPTELGRISTNLSDTKLPRGKAVFGKSADILRQIAKSENATFHVEDGKVNIVKPEDLPPGEIIELSPSSGLIGVPAQQDYGATIRMLLSPRVRIGSLVHVDNSLIRNQQYNVGQPIYQLDQDGIYRVIHLEFEGDSRGQPWWVTAETVSQSGILPSMVSNGSAVPW